MSVHVSSWAWRLDVGDPETKLVLLKLADHADDRGYCYPSIDLIVRDTCLSRSTVLRRLKKLEDAGLLERERQRQGARNGGNRYRLAKPTVESVPQTPSTTGSEFLPGYKVGVPQTPEPSLDRQALSNERAPATLYDALVAACYPPNAVLTAREKRRCAIAATNIASAGGTPGMVPAVKRAYTAHTTYGRCILTVMALSEHWAELAPTVGSRACPECGVAGNRHSSECSLGQLPAAGQ